MWKRVLSLGLGALGLGWAHQLKAYSECVRVFPVPPSSKVSFPREIPVGWKEHQAGREWQVWVLVLHCGLGQVSLYQERADHRVQLAANAHEVSSSCSLPVPLPRFSRRPNDGCTNGLTVTTFSPFLVFCMAQKRGDVGAGRDFNNLLLLLKSFSAPTFDN